jgi:cysteine-rich repeat protein
MGDAGRADAESTGLCGNGDVEADETCDDGNTVDGDGCSSACETEPDVEVVCGDGSMDGAEGCDDGNLVDGDGCSSACEIETGPECGDGTMEGEEGCDDGNLVDGDGCSSACEIEAGPECGDGTMEGEEACDDGNTVDGDGCSSACEIEAGPECGDGTMEGDEACDDGNVENGDGCSSTCEIEPDPEADCGNNVLEEGEACDDGNLEDGDGCSSVCEIEAEPVCGNGELEAGEACDDGNENDHDVCTNQCEINPNPEGECGDAVLNAGEDCDDGNLVNGDGCSALCTVEMPGAECGNGALEDGESCDDGNLVAGDGCDAACQIEVPVCGDGTVDEGEGCDDGNNVDGDGCAADCSVEPFCGDGTLDEGEACDDGNNVDGDRCDAACAIEPFCGDGTLDEGEACDDGNEVDGDHCSALCVIEAFCGDGALDAGEACDDGNNAAGDGCSAGCALEASCGDGTLDEGEGCDDGNNDAGDGCAADCSLEPFCGDGTLDEGEACDDGNNVDGDRCDAGCAVEPFCGDGTLDAGEGCDDGNEVDGDHCSALCEIEAFCGDGALDEGEGCDDGNNDAGDGCAADCSVEPFCGDGALDEGEACDDGNNVSGDGCEADCTFEAVCGDGALGAGEACDDGNLEAGDGCAPDCTLEPFCGDGAVHPELDEICDDGNNVAGDGCAPDCTLETPCGDGALDEGEQCDDGNLINGDGCDQGCTEEVFDLIHGIEQREGALGAAASDTWQFMVDGPSNLHAETSLAGAPCPPGTVDTAMVLVELLPDGTERPVAANDDAAAEQRCSAIDAVLQAGLYRLRVTEPQGEPVAAYQLDVRLAQDISAGGAYAGATPADGDDLYDLVLQAPTTAGLVISDGEAGCPGFGTLTVYGLDEAGDRVQIAQAGGFGGEVPGDLCAPVLIEFEAGVYEVEATVLGEGVTPYTLGVQFANECGDGVLGLGEMCDPGPDVADDFCDAACQLLPGCGNGLVEPDEQCDDGNNVNADGCDVVCTDEVFDLIDGVEQRTGGFGAEATDTWRFVVDGPAHVRASTGVLLGEGEVDACPVDGIDTRMTLLRVEGEARVQVAVNDDANALPCAALDLALETAGRYELVISDPAGAATPAYQLDYALKTDITGGGDFAGAYVEDGDDHFTLVVEAPIVVRFETGDGAGGCSEAADDDTTMTLYRRSAGEVSCEDACFAATYCGAFDFEEGPDFGACMADCEEGMPLEMRRCFVDAAPDCEFTFDCFEGGGGGEGGGPEGALVEIDDNDDFSEGLCSAIERQLAPGEYEVWIQGYDDSAHTGYVLNYSFSGACGDGVLNLGEECDDANLDVGDGCDALCLIEPECGNGVLERTEACDDGNVDSGDGCDVACTLEAFDFIHSIEQAEGGFGLGAADTWRFVVDGPSHLQTHTSLAGAACAPETIDTLVTLYAVDAEGALQEIAQSDGGEADLCGALDRPIEAGAYALVVRHPAGAAVAAYQIDYRLTRDISAGGAFDGAIAEDGDDRYTFVLADARMVEIDTGCNADTDLILLGPGEAGLTVIRTAGGACPEIQQGLAAGAYEVLVVSDGAVVDAYTLGFQFDGVCGDGVLNLAEQCDDGNVEAGDGCDAVCAVEPECGDGVLHPAEACEDGNLINGDGCDVACTEEVFDLVRAIEQRAGGFGAAAADTWRFMADGPAHLQVSTSLEGEPCVPETIATEVTLFAVDAEGARQQVAQSEAAEGTLCGALDLAFAEAGAYELVVDHPAGSAVGAYQLDYRLTTDVSAEGAFDGAYAEAGSDRFVFVLEAPAVVRFETGDGAGGCSDDETDTEMHLYRYSGEGDASCEDACGTMVECGLAGEGGEGDLAQCMAGCEEGFSPEQRQCIANAGCGAELFECFGPIGGPIAMVVVPPAPGALVQIAYDDDGGVDRCSAIERALTPGVYEVMVEDLDDGAHPGYVLSVLSSGECGDGVLNLGEECDDNNLDEGDGCDAACLIEPECGDGLHDEEEACEDGNVDNGDGCDSACTLEQFEIIEWHYEGADAVGDGASDTYAFTLDDAGVVRFETSDGAGGCEGVGFTQVQLFAVFEGADPVLVASSDNAAGCSTLTEAAPAGAYLVVVTEADGGALPGYTATFSAVVDAAAGGAFAGTFPDEGSDGFMFNLVAENRVTMITDDGHNCPGDTEISLLRLDPDSGELLFVDSDDDGAFGECSHLERYLEPGTYVVEVDGDHGDPSDDYTLSVLFTRAPTPGELVITEIASNPSVVVDSAGEWFELFNASDAPLQLQGLVVSDDGADQFQVMEDFIIDPGAFLVFGKSDDDEINGNVSVDYVYQRFFLSNGSDEVVLSLNGVELDRVAYDNGVTFPDPSGASMQFDGRLDPSEADNASGDSWCVSVGDLGFELEPGTPGRVNTVCGQPRLDPTAGDRCEAPIEVLQSGTVRGNSSGLTSQFDQHMECTGYAWSGADVFYSVQLEAGQTLRVTANEVGGWDSGLYIFTDCADPADSCAAGCDASCRTSVTAEAAGTYLVALDGWDGENGVYELTFEISAGAAR